MSTTDPGQNNLEGPRAAFDIAYLSATRRSELLQGLTSAGVEFEQVGPELQVPGADSELVELLVARADAGQPVWSPADAHDAHGLGGRHDGLVLATRWARLGVYLLETFVVGLVLVGARQVSVGATQVVAVLVGLVSGVVMVATVGATAGMWVFGLRIVVPPTTEAPGWRVAIIRYLVVSWPGLLLRAQLWVAPESSDQVLNAVMSIWVFACFAPILFDPARRGLHDRAAGTLVVTTRTRLRTLAAAGHR